MIYLKHDDNNNNATLRLLCEFVNVQIMNKDLSLKVWYKRTS